MPGIFDAVFNQDIFEGGGVVFDPPPPQSLQFVHRTISGISADRDNVEFPFFWTRLDHPTLNGDPRAIISVTPRARVEVNTTTQSARLIHNPHPVGVVYRNDRWFIYNLGLQAMEINVDFAVAIHEARRPE